MPLVKKIDPNWRPVEQPDIQVGETRNMSAPWELLKAGVVVLVDEEGNEIPYEQEMRCPICSYVAILVPELSKHLLTHQKVQPKIEPVVVASVAPDVAKTTEEELTCVVCGFVSKSAFGLSAHTRKHK